MTQTASSYTGSLDIRPLGGALGAEVFGVDLTRDLDDGEIAAVRGALLDHLVIFFRDQRLTPEQHLAFARRFGTLNVHDYVPGMSGHPELMEIVKEADDTGYNFGGVWHTDLTFLETPALGSILYAKEVPDYGGDTLFTNMYLAHETLSPGMQAMLAGLRAVHTPGRTYGPAGRYSEEAGAHARAMSIESTERALAEVTHPVVRTHPETGRRLLFVNPSFTVRFVDMTEAESRPLLEFLYRHQQSPAFSCRFRWSTHAVAFWDNRCTQHFALNDYHGSRRRMQRATINGDVPV